MKQHLVGYKNMYIDSVTHTALKIAASKANVTMRVFAETAINEKITAMEAQGKKK